MRISANSHFNFMSMNDDYVKIVNKAIITTVGVTDLVEKYKQPFDADFWSKYKALEYLLGDSFGKYSFEIMSRRKISDDLIKRSGVSLEELEAKRSEILLEWDNRNSDAKKRGTEIHSMLEGGDIMQFSDMIGGSDIEVVAKHDIVCGRNAVYKELPLSYYDEENGFLLKGQADLVSIKDNELVVCDYKTSKKISKKSHFDKENKQYQMMKYPVNNLYDSNYYHYSLQLSFYAWMIRKKNPELKIKDLYIVHYDDKMKKTVMKAEYLPMEVTKLIKDYIKRQTVKQMYDKNKPFEY